MGEAKRKQYSREAFLREHTTCVYCGDVATTTDHCPPRCFFEGRRWPETYEFPACEKCNQLSRLDEQAMAVLVRIRMGNMGEVRKSELEKLLQAIANNQHELLDEWLDVSATQHKRVFREKFGQAGDALRYAGFRALGLGPLSDALIDRFAVKLGKALYYRHNGAVFEGYIYIRICDLHVMQQKNPNIREDILRLAPVLADLQRGAKKLSDQFIYRYYHNSSSGILHAALTFASQFLLSIMMIRQDTADALDPWDCGKARVFHCVLKQSPQPAVLSHSSGT
jgi:hypothetical protein